jgi:TonB family protein
MKRSPFFILIALAVLTSVQPQRCCAQDEQSANASPRKVVNKVVPVYPQMARGMNLSGTVKLEVLVQASGSAKSIQVKGGNPLLVQSAQAAVHVWKWEKADHETTEQVEFHFTP